MMNSNDQIRQILCWLAQRPSFAQFFFANPEAALDDLAAAGFAIAPKTRRHFTGRKRLHTKADLDKALDIYFPDWTKRDISPATAYDLPFPIQEEDKAPVAMGGGGGDDGFEDLEESAPPTEPEKTAEKVVSTGFAAQPLPQTPLLQQPLTPATDYYFWLEVGEPVEHSIERQRVELPIDKLPPEASLRVVLYAFEGELEIVRGADVGGLKVLPTGQVVVEMPVADSALAVDEALLHRRLFFPVRTPPTNGRFQLRCNIYYQNCLVQGRVITAQVGEPAAPTSQPPLVADVDYTLSHSLNGRQLAAMGQTRLSLMLNDNGHGTHGFRFFGGDEFKNDASLSEGELTNLINMARAVLRRAAWGDDQPYAAGKTYRYADGLNLSRLKKDLILFAQRGYRFYAKLINNFAGDGDKAWELADLMLPPGQVQLASKENVRLVVPLALFYDYPLDDGKKLSDYRLCDTFVEALQTQTPLQDTPCFQGQCPQLGDLLTVCPCGFWGFRHSLGLPVSIKTAPDAPIALQLTGKPTIDMSVSTDPNFRERPGHEQRLEAMGIRGDYADSRDEALALMKKSEAEVVYFYCHGGVDKEGLPYLSLGPVGKDRFTPSILQAHRIRWRKLRPLVFINGCHTTALTPEHALDLVSGFVETSHAAGVIGTEITIFEPIATQFAENFFRHFLLEKQTAGEAVRQARLAMLQAGNPLGLVYIPYVMPALKLV